MQRMNESLQAIQRFFADFGHRLNSEWLPVLEANFLLFCQWLFAQPIATLGISVVLLLWACLVIRKSTHSGWTFVRVLLTIFLFVLGFGGTLIVLHVA
jgi:hypothetical protein